MSDNHTPDTDQPTVPGDTEAMAAELAAEKKTVSQVLLSLANDRYRVTASTDGGVFALELDGPNIAWPVKGERGVRQQLAHMYYQATGRAANTAALSDAIAVLEGGAVNSPPEQVWLRIGQHADGYVLDLGTPDGRAVVITPTGWHIADRSPVVFRRNELTLELPEPERGGDPRLLLDVLNVAPADAPALLGWLVAALVSDIPHPILLLTGEQGTGKSTAADLLVQLVDPAKAPLLSPPANVDGWMHSAGGSWLVAVDNLSGVPQWLSDSLCRAATGDGQRNRTLYSNDDYSVRQFRRCVILTGIALDNWRGDLAERLLTVELQRINPAQRQTEAELRQRYEAARPRVLGGLLDVLCQVLAIRDQVTVPDLPRMADFARLLAAVDQVTDWGSLDAYRATTGNVAADVVASDPVAAFVVKLVEENGEWSGTPGELLHYLNERAGHDGRAPKGWPSTPAALGSRLKSMAQALLTVGVNYEQTRNGKTRRYHLTRSNTPPAEPSLPSPPSQVAQLNGFTGDSSGDGYSNQTQPRHLDPAADAATEQAQLTIGDSSDSYDDLLGGLFVDYSLTNVGRRCAACDADISNIDEIGYCQNCGI
jgi:hypothetical protein